MSAHRDHYFVQTLTQHYPYYKEKEQMPPLWSMLFPSDHRDGHSQIVPLAREWIEKLILSRIVFVNFVTSFSEQYVPFVMLAIA